jgi:hypothetical protein
VSEHLVPEEEPIQGHGEEGEEPGPEPESGEKPEGEPQRREGQVTEE